METIKSNRISEEYFKIKHKSGLTILLCPKKEFSTSYALFATKYGSVDTCFKTNKQDEFVTVPEGIAHFLEHKLFENEDGDAFSLYAKTGASANAYTSFDRTAYLFSCTDNFESSLEILLNFVTSPYFTAETVQKEQGIIGQEIKMYDDNPDWRVFFNLLGLLYKNNPVRIDIAGTVESISKIDADLLYRCYNTFYNLNNMVLAIAGNFEVETVIRLADKILKKSEDIEIDYKKADEPFEVASKYKEQILHVAVPLFQIGFKATPQDAASNLKNQVLDEILLEVIAGEFTPIYRKLYDSGLINATFVGEIMSGRDYICSIFSGESRNPQQVYDELCAEINRIKAQGIDDKIFRLAKKSTYGRYIGMFSRVEAVAGLMLLSHFSGVNMYDLPEIVADATIEQLNDRLKHSFDTSRSALSVVASAPLSAQ